jgi:PAS domain-containing protein
LLHDILVDLLPKVDLRVRQQLAEQLTTTVAPPPELLSLLVHDVPEVSDCLLDHPDVTDGDLMYIIEGGDDARLNKISNRANLSPQLRKALAKAWLRKSDLPEAKTGSPITLEEKPGETWPEDPSQPEGLSQKEPPEFLSVVPKEEPAPAEKIAHLPIAAADPGKNAVPDNTPVPEKTVTDKSSAAEKPLTSAALSAVKANKDAENNKLIDATEIFAVETNFLQDVTRSAIDWTWETGRDGLITHLSDQSLRAFGQPARLMTGLDLNDYCRLTAVEGQPRNLHSLLQRWRPFRDIRILTTDTIGQERHWLMSGVPCFELYSGRFTGFCGAACEIAEDAKAAAPADVTYLAAAEQQKTPATAKDFKQPAPAKAKQDIIISSAAKNIDKNTAELIQTLSHELRTPLNAILGFSEMIDLETLGPVSETYHEKIRVILRSAHHLKNVITDVLDVARLRAGKQHLSPRFFSLSAVLRVSFEAVRKDAEARNIILLPPQLARDVPLLNDPEYIERCLIKILTYIISHATPCETLWLTVRPAADRKVNIDLPLLGRAGAGAADQQPESPREEKTGLPGNNGSIAFALSVAADLAQVIGGEIHYNTESAQGPFLRLTLGDYPITTPKSHDPEGDGNDTLEDIFANEA